MEQKILHLSLKKEPFQVMVTGEKKEEFITKSDWIISRLINKKTNLPKDYTLIKFTWGYGKKRPYFICQFLGFRYHSRIRIWKRYSNGLFVKENQFCGFIILLGPIVEVKNMPSDLSW
jgi:hypothetical protein